MSIEIARTVTGGRVIEENGAAVDMAAVLREKELAEQMGARAPLAIASEVESAATPPVPSEPAEPVTRPWDLPPLDSGDTNESSTFDPLADAKGFVRLAIAVALMLPGKAKPLPAVTVQHTDHF